jgi:Asp-tRNA(Asn)/Glu-tRNA(Gln) amidotransferase C subunit
MGLFSRSNETDHQPDNSSSGNVQAQSKQTNLSRDTTMSFSMQQDQDPIKMFNTNFLSGLAKHSDSTNLDSVKVDERIGVNFSSIAEEHQASHSEKIRKEISNLYPNARVTITRRDERAWDIGICGIFDLRDYFEKLKSVTTRIDIAQFNYVNGLYIEENNEVLYKQYASVIEQIKNQIASYLKNASNFEIENKIAHKVTRTFEELPGHKVRIKGLDVEINPQFVTVITQVLSNGLKCRIDEVNSAYKNTTELVLAFEHNNPETTEKARVADIIRFDSTKSSKTNLDSVGQNATQATIIPTAPPAFGDNLPTHLRGRTVGAGDKK